MYSKDLLMKHMEKGGHIFRITGKKKDRFFYKLEDGQLMCRCNELGGWHPAAGPIKWGRDKMEIAELDYDMEGFGRDSKVIYIKLPTLKETTGYKIESVLIIK